MNADFPAASSPTDWIDLFHQHMDECDHCINHPLDLCAIGNTMLRFAGEQIDLDYRQRLATLPEVHA